MSTGIITNRILDPSGTAVPNIVVNARLMPGTGFQDSGAFYEFSQLKSTTTDSNGDWSLTLEINTDIDPGDSYYEIEEQITQAWGVPTVWSVQVASGTHTLFESLVSTPPSVSVPSYITQSSGDARYLQPGAGITGGPIQSVGTATITGTATVASPANHQHPLSPAVVGSGLALTAGVLSVTTAVPVAGEEITAVGTNTATGTTTTFARTNHGHALNPSVVGSGLSLVSGVILGPVQGSRIQAVGTMTVTGTATSWAADNHAHVLSPAVAGDDIAVTAGTINVTPRVPIPGSLIQAVGTNTQTGTSTSFARENHVHIISPDVVGSGLTLTNGVLSAPPAGLSYGGAQDITAVSTATATGTATTVARADHQHPLGPGVVGTGLALASGVLSVSGLTNSHATAGWLFTQVSTTTTTVGVSQGQIKYDSASTAVYLFNGAFQIRETPISAVVATAENTNSTSYTDLATAGPSVTLLTGTKAIIWAHTTAQNNAAPDACYLSYAVSGATTIAAADTKAVFANSAGNGYNQVLSACWSTTALTPGYNTFTLKYRVSGNTGTFAASGSGRWITVQALP